MIELHSSLAGVERRIQEASQNGTDRITIPIILFKKFRHDNPFFIHEESSGERNSVSGLIDGDCVIQNFEFANHPGVPVGKKGKSDMAPFGEAGQNFLSVIADGAYPQTFFFQGRQIIFQLDQLGFTKGSPIRGTVKDEECPFGSFHRLEGLLSSKLIGQAEIGNRLPHRGASFYGDNRG
jgi:hypothetical protein